jgi:hypothetical protein
MYVDMLIFYVLLFGFVYLAWWDGSDKGTASNVVQISEEVQQRLWQWLDIWGRQHEPYTENLNSLRPKKVREVKSKVRSMFIIFFDIKGIVKKIHPGRPNSQFCILLWCFMVTAWKCTMTLPQTLATKELVVASRQHTVSHFLFHCEILTKNNMAVIPSHTLLFSVSPIEDKTERLPFWHNWGDRGRVAGYAEHHHRTWLPEFI